MRPGRAGMRVGLQHRRHRRTRHTVRHQALGAVQGGIWEGRHAATRGFTQDWSALASGRTRPQVGTTAHTLET
eukprot:1531705-Prorocentrum_lima.AAC.1